MNYKTTSTIKFRHLKWLILAIIIGILAFFAYRQLNPTPTAPTYLTGTVEAGSIENSVMASGKIEAISTVDVGAQVSGEITKLYVEVGDQVKKGDLIAQISQVNQKNIVANNEASLQQAQASLAQAEGELASKQGDVIVAVANIETKEAELTKAQASFDRLKGLIEINAISQEEYDNARSAVAVAKAAVSSAKASHQNALIAVQNAKTAIASQQAAIVKAQNDVHTAQEDLSHTIIRAPIDGTVISVSQKQGTTVNANQSAPTIVTLADLNRVRINAQISEADVVKIDAHFPIKFNIIGNPEQKFDASLSGIEPAPKTVSGSNDDAAVYYIAYAYVDNPDGKFRIDMTTQVNIIINQAKNTLIIPSSAIIEKEGKNWVRIKGDDGFAKEIPVQVGINNRVNAQILSGLKQGDTIILGEANADEKKEKSNNRGNRPPMM